MAGCAADATRPRLSIIVPCLNEAACIATALDRLQPLRSRGAEVIVVDGESSDGSAELAHPRADRVLTAARGRASQMNAGVARSLSPIHSLITSGSSRAMSATSQIWLMSMPLMRLGTDRIAQSAAL